MSRFDKSPVRDGVRGNIPLSRMHTSTSDFFRWDCVDMHFMVPKDICNMNIHAFVEGSPNPYPVNGSMNFGMYSFFVPFRLLWKDWKFYMTDLESNLTQPYFTLGDLWEAFHSDDNPWAHDGMFDEALRYISNIHRLGAIVHFIQMQNKSDIPLAWQNLRLLAYPLRAMQNIWFDWLRDKAHLSDMAKDSYCLTTGGHISVEELIQLCCPKYRCYKKDYITTAFDKPSEDILSAPASLTRGEIGNTPGSFDDNVSVDVSMNLTDFTSRSQRFINSPEGDVYNIGTRIEDLRISTSKQTYGERLLFAGKTVMSRALALLGVAPTIEELQMVNYLGGHESELLFKTTASPASGNVTDVNPTLKSAGSFGYNPANGVFAGQKHMNVGSPDDGYGLENVTYRSDETGILVTLSCIMPNVQYYQGLPRDWFRGIDTFASDKFDYFHSDFENLGLQPVLNYEVCCDEQISPKGVYGFQQQYIDYKFSQDSIGGDFILTDPNPDPAGDSRRYGLSLMHLGRNIRQFIRYMSQESGESAEQFLSPSYLTQATFADVGFFDELFTIATGNLDHFIVNYKITRNTNRPMQENAMSSLDSELSRLSSKKLIETSGFRL